MLKVSLLSLAAIGLAAGAHAQVGPRTSPPAPITGVRTPTPVVTANTTTNAGIAGNTAAKGKAGSTRKVETILNSGGVNPLVISRDRALGNG